MTEANDEDACFDFIERGNDCLHDKSNPDYWGAADAYGEASISLAKLGTAKEGCGDERVPRLYRDQGVEYLQKGRDALIKALLNEMECGRHGIVTESSAGNDGGFATITPKMQLSPDEVAIRTATFQRLYALPCVAHRPTSPPDNIFAHDDESLLSPVSARSGHLDPSSTPPPPTRPPPRLGMLSDVTKSERNMRQRLEALQRNDVAPSPSSGDRASEEDIALRLERLGVRVPNSGARAEKGDLLQMPMTDADRLRTLMSAARDEADLDSLDSRLRSMGDMEGRLSKLGVVVPKSDRGGERHGEPTPLSEQEEVDLVVSAAIDEANVADEENQEVEESSKGVAENMNSVEESAVSKGGGIVPEKNSSVASLTGDMGTDNLGESEVIGEISLDDRLSEIVADAESGAGINSGPIAYDELYVNENDAVAGARGESMENALSLLLHGQGLLFEAGNCLDCSAEEESGDAGEALEGDDSSEVARLERAKSGRELMIQAKMVLEKAIKALDDSK